MKSSLLVKLHREHTTHHYRQFITHHIIVTYTNSTAMMYVRFFGVFFTDMIVLAKNLIDIVSDGIGTKTYHVIGINTIQISHRRINESIQMRAYEENAYS